MIQTLVDVDVFEKALIYAVKKHKGQRRKGNGRPYILHPISVMNRIQTIKESTNIYLLGAVAILHDVCEDCGVSIKKIAKKFGYHVASIVQELTLDKSNYQTIGKTEYLCKEMMKMSSYALAIKLCDRLDNVSDMSEMDSTFQIRYIGETEAILDAISNRKLSKTHDYLIDLIKLEVLKYKK